MSTIEITKTVEEGRVYALQTFGEGRQVLEKIDPRVTHDAPPSVPSGTEIAINFAIVDFDGLTRSESGGTLLLDIDDTEIALPINSGVATLTIQLFASATLRQRPPYFCDARMEPFEIGVTA